jgi:HEPN domain-containing protein
MPTSSRCRLIMKISEPEDYFQAGLERLRQAQALYDRGDSYALAMYVTGVSVECLLRAFKMLRDPTFDEKHDLRRLFKASGMLSIDPAILQAKGLSEAEAEGHFRELQAAVTAVCDLWSNGYRFASEKRLRAHLRNRRLERGSKGDLLKANALLMLRAAGRFHNKGGFQWKSLRRSKPS